MNADQVAAALALFFGPDDVFEVRALDHGGPGKNSAGWFKGSAIDQAAALVVRIGAAGGVYFTPNPSSDECYQRCGGMIRPAFFKLTADADVPARRWLIIDVDPVRPDESKKDSATDEEKAAAGEVADRVRAFLAAQGCAAPVVIDSGNGVHLYYRLTEQLGGGHVADPSADQLAGVLTCLNARFGTRAAEIDTTIFNASRLMKVPGTPARKGPGTADRPHRMSRVVEVPDDWHA
ncbi:MAG TPA: hypothetical protein VD866_22245 [Urbifossiella sp.]|nr:hypothetical protein [Urbifossiella sp.]